MAATIVEILDINLRVITPIKALKPFDAAGNVLQYSKELSDFGRCRFRVSAYDPILIQYGDILQPHKYHVRLRKGSTIIWQGAIIENPHRNKSYIEVIAVEYEFYLSKVLVTRSSPDVNGTADIYRIFNSGTMAAAVTAIINETIAKYQNSAHVLSAMTLGTVENPNFPPNMVSDYVDGSGNNTPLTGPWTFGTGIQTAQGPTLQFDYHNILYILKAFGIYSYSDFGISNTLQFNFKKFLGNNLLSQLTFSYGQQGNIIDYNLPRKGERQANNLWVIATDPNGVILHANPTDQTAISEYGLLEDVAAYADVKSQSLLNVRGAAELPLIATPDETNAIVYLNEKGYPLGQYDIGDVVTIKVINKAVNFNQIRRIVGITVSEHETGREMIALQTNIPLPWQYPSS
jgi:hypothetical protein